MNTFEKQGYVPFSIMDILPAMAALALLGAVAFWNFLLFRSLIELFSVMISGAAFLMTWNVRKRMESGFLLFIATAYVAVSALDTIRLLAFEGMAVFPGFTANQAMQLWLAARFLQALSLLVAPLFATRHAPAGIILGFYAVADFTVLLMVFRPWPFLPAFPDCQVAGLSPHLTPFKVTSEFVICATVLAAMGLLTLMRQWVDRMVMRFMMVSMGALIASELFLAGSGLVFGPMNGIGHMLKAVSFYLAYKALIEAGLVRPFDVLFRSATQSRQQVLESEERFRTLSSATFEGIAITENGRIVDVNEQLLDMLGRTREELVGEPVSAFLVPEDRERVLQSIREGMETQVDHRMVRKDGSSFDVETHGKMVHFKNRTVRVTAIRDVTERKRAEESLWAARNTALRTARDLAQSNQDLEQFAHVTSHDLKEPLRMVSGFMGLLKERYAERLDDKAREYIQFAVDASQRMQRLVDDLLEYSRIGRDEMREIMPLGEAVEAAQSNLSVAIKESGAVITCDALPALRVNRITMIQLFQNLLSNAVKFRADRPPLIHVGAGLKEGGWEFVVRDNGIGIDPAYQDRLFKIFQRLHPPEDFPGSGVGLAICKKIVDRYGGDIRVESEPGRGSAFFFTLPDAGGSRP